MLASIFNNDVKNWNETVLTINDNESVQSHKTDTSTIESVNKMVIHNPEIFRPEFENDSIIECF